MCYWWTARHRHGCHLTLLSESDPFLQHRSTADTSRGYKQPHRPIWQISISDLLARALVKKTSISPINLQGFEEGSIVLYRETGEAAVCRDAYLAPLPIEASPLLRLLDDVAQLLVGQLQVLRQEVGPLLGRQPLKDVQHAAIVVESWETWREEKKKWGGFILNHCLFPVKVTQGQMSKSGKSDIFASCQRW